MRRIITVLVILGSLLFGNLFAQDMPMHKNKRKQIRQLEQLKLIEVLDLDEETSVRFFARRNKYLDNVAKFQKKRNRLVNELERKIEDGEKYNAKEYREKLETLEKKILQEKINFFNSLDDILTNEQLGKLIVFQKRFRREIMREMMKKRRERMREMQ